MDTEYASQINTRPVIYLTFKDCKGMNADQMFASVKTELYREYLRHEKNMRDKLTDSYETQDFYSMIEILRARESSCIEFGTAILRLTQIVKEVYQTPPILLIDEYDQRSFPSIRTSLSPAHNHVIIEYRAAGNDIAVFIDRIME